MSKDPNSSRISHAFRCLITLPKQKVIYVVNAKYICRETSNAEKYKIIKDKRCSMKAGINSIHYFGYSSFTPVIYK